MHRSCWIGREAALKCTELPDSTQTRRDHDDDDDDDDEEEEEEEVDQTVMRRKREILEIGNWKLDLEIMIKNDPRSQFSYSW